MLLFTALVLLAGCGRKGALVPPEALVPAPINDLAVAQKGGHFLLSWSVPAKQQGGARLRDLAGFLLYRRLLLPAAEDCEECQGAYSQLARVDLEYLQGARRSGNRMLLDDFDLKEGKSYRYKVRSFATDGAQSRDSNKVSRTAVYPPFPPVLEALSSTTGVVLAFVALPPEQGTLIGYNVFRSKKDVAMPLSPLNAEPITANTFEDKSPLLGVVYSYTVTTLAKVNGDVVESAQSNYAEGSMLERD
jgi:hypothetical protein